MLLAPLPFLGWQSPAVLDEISRLGGPSLARPRRSVHIQNPATSNRAGSTPRNTKTPGDLMRGRIIWWFATAVSMRGGFIRPTTSNASARLAGGPPASVRMLLGLSPHFDEHP